MNIQNYLHNHYAFFLSLAKDNLLQKWKDLDDKLLKTKPKNLIVKDRCTKTIWTPQTDLISFTRRRYYDKKTKKYRYLLDEHFGFDKYKFISKAYQELALLHFDKFRSYKDIAKIVFNGRVSKQSIHNFIKNHKSKFTMKNYVCKSEGILWINCDGLWLKKNKSPKATEIKNFVLFSNRKLDVNSRKWKLEGRTLKHFTNKTVEFMAEKLREIILQYDGVREVRLVGDGAIWIRKLAKEIGAIFYIDKFHYSKAINDLLGKTSKKKYLVYSLIDAEISKKEFRLSLLKIVSSEQSGEVTKAQIRLVGYLTNNLNYYIRNSKYDNPINCIEAIQAHYQAKFFKNRRKGWSVKVLNNLISYINSKLNKGQQLEFEIDSINNLNFPQVCNYGIRASLPGSEFSGFVSHIETKEY